MRARLVRETLVAAIVVALAAAGCSSPSGPKPADLPTLYTTSAEGQFFRSVQQSQDVADPLWSSVLDDIAPKAARSGPFARLCFNFMNPLVRRLLEVRDPEVLRRSIQMLYVQSLLLGHHPLSAREMTLLNEGLLGLIELSLGADEESHEPTN